MTTEFAYLYGKPKSSGLLRSQMSDFKVFEQLPFSPCGEGEHLYIYIRKTGANTVFVARELAKYFQVKEQLVSYAGLKDRFAVTEQWFAVHLPGKQTYDLSDVNIEGVEVLSFQRHNKKLRTGALSGNRFELTLRKVTELNALAKRWQEITQGGVPNYFGEQRFGIDGGNIARAEALFAGTKVKDKKKRGIYLSAARSYLFNQIVEQRIKQNNFNQPLVGDVMMLAGSQSVFKLAEVDEEINQRFREHDIDITAPMWGAGELLTLAEPKELEQNVADQNMSFCQGLAKFGLKQERRRIRLVISDADIDLVVDDQEQDSTVKVSFFLPAGCYATTVLRELVNYQDMTQRVQAKEAEKH
ncbi:tRNA pseudouridine(13) synthase TruD [Litorilituus sediminis]|uniref:tRNA pseudouridine synthase D n=1 Tax=Litorilituus sediminis TaxID=718192 RepID=A0A4P6P5P9_9GAMM|nr:tRNA pseudouridine(13) synthase TruD [Litorilituus sediminis]QBG35469.1 tRNA pseudouridine(13) synthase TruD [Litorilituus sediminis]